MFHRFLQLGLPVIYRDGEGGSGGGGQQPPSPPAPPEPPQPQGGQPPAQPPSFEEWLKDPVNAGYTKKLRDENAGWRNKLKESTDAQGSLMRSVLEALGIKPDEGQPNDVAKALEELTQRDQAREQKFRQATLKAALAQAVAKHGADADIVTPYLRGNGALDQLDIEADGFEDKVSEIVGKLVEQNPKFKAGQPAPTRQPVRSGGDFRGGGGNGNTSPEPQTPAEWLRAGYEESSKT